jgi:hypothetical protein
MRRLLVTAVAAGCASAPGSAEASSAHLALRVRIGDHPAFVRAVVDFTDGRLRFQEVEATDPFPFRDGRVALRVDVPGVRTQAAPARAHGIIVRLAQARNRVFVAVTATPRRFKYIDHFLLSRPERAVIDLWKAAPPTPAAEVRRGRDGCLTLAAFSVAGGRVTAAGRERNLFEHNHVVSLRGANGAIVAERPVTSSGGRWRVSFPYRVPRSQAGTLEGVALSARDGALACIVQARVRATR